MGMLSEYERTALADQFSEACRRHVLSHSAGVLNRALRANAIAPDTGRVVECDTPGSASPMKWGRHHFVLSAGHVLEKAEPGDLRVATYASLPNEYLAPEAVRSKDLTAGSPLDEDSHIHHCAWEDLAIVTVDPDNFPGVDFTDLALNWSDPMPGVEVSRCGFPSEHHIPVTTVASGGGNQMIELGIYPTLFHGTVTPFPSGEDVKFYYDGLDPRKHYLIPYLVPGATVDPPGFSGSATWQFDTQKQEIWTPRFKFAGTVVAYHRKKQRLRVVNASSVRRFVAEIFGEP